MSRAPRPLAGHGVPPPVLPAAGPLVAGLLVAGLLAPPTLSAQDLGARVRGSEGPTAFHVVVREGVRVCDHGIASPGGRIRWDWRGREEDPVCSTGLAEVVLTVRGGSVRRLDLEPWEGEGSTPGGVRNLGRAPAEEAAAFLVSLARSDRDALEAAEDGLSAAMLVDSVEAWPELLAVARDRSRPGELRETAIFWLGRAASEAVTADLAELAADEEEEQDVRDAAVFALSRRPDDEAVPALMELARTAREADTRRSAMFWLARSDDERVLPFFEEILLGRAGGA